MAQQRGFTQMLRAAERASAQKTAAKIRQQRETERALEKQYAAVCAAEVAALKETQRAQKRAAAQASREEHALEKARAQQYVTDRMAECAVLNAELEDRMKQLSTILTEGLSSFRSFDIASLRRQSVYPAFNAQSYERPELPPVWDSYCPAKPMGVAALWPVTKKRYERDVDTGARQLALPLMGAVGLLAVLAGQCMHHGAHSGSGVSRASAAKVPTRSGHGRGTCSG